MSAPAPTLQTELTTDEVDAYLIGIVNALKNGKEPNRELAFKRCDKWLDLRNSITKGGE